MSQVSKKLSADQQAQDFLLEIGTEEIPAKFMPGALAQIQDLAEKACNHNRLSYSKITAWGTPRRLALYITKLIPEQQDVTLEVKGPAKKAAYDAAGKPSKALEGFARSQGVKLEQLVVKEVANGEYVFALKQETGRRTIEILPEIILQLITGLNFPKPMRWAYSELRFARPIRWLVALYGKTLIPFTIENISTGQTTYGHRFLSKGLIKLNSAQEYLIKLAKQGYVLVDQDKRRELIWQQIQELATIEGGEVQPDEELLEEVTHLLEYPTALCGNFSPDYLELPKEVLITPMREHQRYFPVLDNQGRLLNKFITVRNGGTHGLETVKEGNEKVLRARLADARFFYQEDLKLPLAQYVDRLKKIVFQESLGTIYEKVLRIGRLVEYLAERTEQDKKTTNTALKTALLCKADLVTNMVYEFPELQGIMGSEYAAKTGETQEVAKAILEHYLPRFAGDGLPTTKAGTIVSIADKIDTIVGCFAAGIQPTGSQDPYALRRQALGVAHMLLNGELNLSLSELMAQAYDGYTGKELKLAKAEVQKEVGEFFKLRLRNIFMELGISYDVVDAILVAGFDRPVDTWQRTVALDKARVDQSFSALLTSFTRVTNLAKKAEGGPIKPELFVETVETQLFQAFTKLQQAVVPDIEQGNYLSWFQKATQLQQPIEDFFTGVMVMAPEDDIRNNRLALLKEISEFFTAVADLSKIVVA
ncbi:MAG: glycine--tRNA ligase subunit beta [Carboxydocellales bacterium]